LKLVVLEALDSANFGLQKGDELFFFAVFSYCHDDKFFCLSLILYKAVYMGKFFKSKVAVKKKSSQAVGPTAFEVFPGSLFYARD